MSKYLYGAAVQGIQGFIFQTNKLREIVGASELVEEICTSELETIFKKVGLTFDPKCCILHAAGNIKYIFENEEKCKTFVRLFPKTIFEFAPGITVSQAVVKMEGKFSAFEDAVNELEKRLRVQRNKPMRSATLGLMGALRSRQSGLPVVEVTKGNEHWDAAKKAKLKISGYTGETDKVECARETTQALCKKAFGLQKVYNRNIAHDIEDIPKDNDWVAIIHADGNGLGKVVQKVGIDPEKFKRFSEKLDEATTKSAVYAYESVKKDFDNPENKVDFIPIRPIVVGGDDLTVICRADLAINYVGKFLEEFEKSTRELLVDENGNSLLKDVFEKETDKRLTACAGIAYVKSSYPFYYGYELAETLCSLAKKDAKDSDEIKQGKALPQSCLILHKVQDSFTEDWDAIAKRELSPQDNISFQFGPYYLNDKPNRWTIEQLKASAEKLEGKDGNAVKSHLRNWLSMLHDNPEMANQKLDRLKSMTTEEYCKFVEDITFKYDAKMQGIQRTPVYDILAIHTINTQKTKEDK